MLQVAAEEGGNQREQRMRSSGRLFGGIPRLYSASIAAVSKVLQRPCPSRSLNGDTRRRSALGERCCLTCDAARSQPWC